MRIILHQVLPKLTAYDCILRLLHLPKATQPWLTKRPPKQHTGVRRTRTGQARCEEGQTVLIHGVDVGLSDVV